MPRLQLTKTTLGNNYRVTIPRKIVQNKGWKKGDNLTIEERDEYLMIYKSK